MRIRRDVPKLRTRRFIAEIEASFRTACDRTRFRLTHYAVLDDHLHLIVEAASARDLACGLKSIAARGARAVNRIFRRRGPVLDDRSHVRVLRTPTEVRRAVAYVLLNLRRHLAQRSRPLPTARWIDPASSGRWFDGWRRPPAAAHDPPAVAAPRTWLLSSGWRRLGLVGTGEVPGS